MAEFSREMDPEVPVEVVTFLSFADGSPTEVVFAGSKSEVAKHMQLTDRGEQFVMDCLIALVQYDCMVPYGG